MFENVSRRHFLQGSAAVAMGLGLAGCGNDGGDSASGDGGSTIKVGILGPHTGDVANYGIACRNGAQLYFDQLNADGGINGKQVEYLVEDEQGDPTQAVTAYNLLVEQGVVGIVGDVTTGPTPAVAQQSVNDNMPCVTPSATAAEIVTYGDNTFRACVTDPEQGRIMAAFANEQGYKNVGTLYLKGDDYNEGVNNAFVEEAQALGITITTEQSYSAGDVDFNSQLTTIIATNPDAILVPNYYEDDGLIVTQARQQGYTGVILGVDGWSGVADYASAEDLQNCYYCCAFSSANTEGLAAQFTADYEEAYGETPTNFCALGYDAAMVLAGIGAVLYVMAYPQATPTMGMMLGTKAFVAAVLGGIGSIPGAVVGAMLVGFAEVFVSAIGLSVWRDAVVFLLLIVVLIVRPTGIFGRTMSEKV